MPQPRFITLIVVACLATLAAAAEEAPQPERDLTDRQRQLGLESFDYVWNTVREKHWDPKLGGLDWEAVGEELRPRVEQATSVAEARDAMQAMLERLEQSHFAIIPGEVYEAFNLPDGEGSRDGTTGIDARVVDGRAVVSSVLDGSPAAEMGVRTGWAIVRIGEDDIAPKLEMVAAEFQDSTYRDFVLATVVLGRLTGRVGERITVQFLDGGDRTVERELTLAPQRGRKVQLGHLPAIHVWIEAGTIDENVGRVAFNMFIDPAHLMPIFNEAMTDFMDAEGIVIDIRGNPGGSPAMAMGMAGWMVEEKHRYLGTMYTRDNELKLVVFPRPTAYRGPVAVLVDGLSGSCAEVFAGGLQDLGRARVFGTRTMGAVLLSAIERLPNGDGFQYASANYVSAGGEALEGAGVVPDVEVAPTREALLQSRDPVLEAAVAWIREQRELSTSFSMEVNEQ
jgi:carboxyl-terminal processing protease